MPDIWPIFYTLLSAGVPTVRFPENFRNEFKVKVYHDINLPVSLSQPMGQSLSRSRVTNSRQGVTQSYHDYWFGHAVVRDGYVLYLS